VRLKTKSSPLTNNNSTLKKEKGKMVDIISEALVWAIKISIAVFVIASARMYAQSGVLSSSGRVTALSVCSPSIVIGIWGCIVLAVANYVVGTEFDFPLSFSVITVTHLILSWVFFRVRRGD
jgi:uncharacterized membrane protein